MAVQHSSNSRASQSGLPGRRWAHTATIGFGAGLLNALVGLGGGILIVPGLVLMRRVPVRAAVATSLGAVLLLSAAALAFHLLAAWLQWATFTADAGGVALMLAAGVVGSKFGSVLLHRIPQRWVMVIFSLVMLLSAVDLLAIGLHLGQSLPAAAAAPPVWSYPLLGVAAGIFSGLLGIGGGALVVLVMSALFHTPVLEGLPIALAVNVTNAAAGVAAQWSSGQILWFEVRALVPSALVGVACGTGLALVLPPDALRVGFALFFIFMGINLMRKTRSV